MALPDRSGDGLCCGHGELVPVVAEHQRGVRAVPQGVGGLLGLDVDAQSQAVPVHREVQPGDAVRELRGEGQHAVVVPHPAEAADQRYPGTGERGDVQAVAAVVVDVPQVEDRKSTRLNSSHVKISYAVFCLKKKKKKKKNKTHKKKKKKKQPKHKKKEKK